MKRRLTERDVTRIVSRVLNEQTELDINSCLNFSSIDDRRGRLRDACKSVKAAIEANKPYEVQKCIDALKMKSLDGYPEQANKMISCINYFINNRTK